MGIITGHFVRTESHATWINTTPNYTPTIADWQNLEQKVAQVVNGDLGGAWAPSTPIIINGQGLVVTGLTTVYGAGVVGQAYLRSTDASSGFVLGDNDYPLLS